MGFAEAAFTEATRRVTFSNDTAYTVSGRLKLAEFRGKITAENIDGYDINLTDASIYDADYNDLTYSIVPAHVDVTIPVNSISLNKSETSIVIGKSETLTAAVQPDNATNKTVSWRSSDASVASVKDGVVTAHKAGTATITATTEDGGRTASCKITVTPKPKPICNAPRKCVCYLRSKTLRYCTCEYFGQYCRYVVLETAGHICRGMLGLKISRQYLLPITPLILQWLRILMFL